jgi:hypothetical protein
MVSDTMLIASELKRKNSKSPAVEDKTKKSCSSVLFTTTSTEGKQTEVRRGYVLATMELEPKNKKKSLEENIKIEKLNNSKFIVSEEMISDIVLKSSPVLFTTTSTEGKQTEVRRGYVLNTMELEPKNKKKSLEENIKIEKLNNSKLIVPEEMSSVIGLKSSHTLLMNKVSDSVTRCK